MPRTRYARTGFYSLTLAVVAVSACQSFVYRGTDFDVISNNDGGQDSAPIRDSDVADSTITDSGAPLDAAADTNIGMTYAQMIMRDGPAAYYRFSDLGGSTTAYNEVSNADDGTYGSAVGSRASGAIIDSSSNNWSLAASGSGMVAPNDIDFKQTEPFSLEAWARISRIDSTYRHLFNKEIPNKSPREQFGLYVTNSGSDGIAFERFVGDEKRFVRTGIFTPIASKWYHIVATYDGIQIRLYLDGYLVSTATDTRSQAAKTTTPLCVGTKFLNDRSQQWPGNVDEVAIYKYALSAGKVGEHYRKGLGN
jgi:Concanavalin A-like lectin/glucanases superfamily